MGVRPALTQDSDGASNRVEYVKDGARRLHESTRHGSPPAHPESLVAYQRLDPRNAPAPFKEYRGDLDEISLPHRLESSSLPATAVLSGMRGETRQLDAARLSTLLFLSAGVTRVAGPPGRRIYFRAAMSAGNLHPVEVYLVVGEGGVEGIGAGVYHFSPLHFSLTALREGDHRETLGISAPLAVVLTGIPWRTSWKYGERGWRHLYWDGGTLLANLLAVADAHGLENTTLLGFDDDAVGRLLGVDGSTEMTLAMTAIGPIEGAEPPAAPAHLEPLSVGVAPVAPRPIRLPLLEAAQADGTLTGQQVEGWRKGGPAIGTSAPSQVETAYRSEDTIETVILRRGSTRRMVRAAVPAGHLEWPLAAAARSIGLDVIPKGSLLRHYVNAHAVEGVDAGAYRHTKEGLAPLRPLESPREASTSLTLGQPLGGESAYTAFHCADLDPIFESLGSRGYRAAQLEAGVVSGRLSLCAFALEMGATGLTFFDEPVSQFFETSDEAMLVTSVGVPAGPPAPYGTPGKPAVLQR